MTNAEIAFLSSLRIGDYISTLHRDLEEEAKEEEKETKQEDIDNSLPLVGGVQVLLQCNAHNNPTR